MQVEGHTLKDKGKRRRLCSWKNVISLLSQLHKRK